LARERGAGFDEACSSGCDANYLVYSEGGFRGGIDVAQVTLAKPAEP